MANLPETSNFDAGVYQLETTDPVVGGPSGVSNTPLKNLANRTLWLKNAIASLATSIADTYAPKASPALTGNPTAPTPSQFDNDTSLATTEFVQTALGSLRGGAVCTGSTTLSASHVGKAIQLSGTGPYTVTMPLAAGLPDGAMIQFNTSASGAITIARQGSELIYPNMGPGVTSFPLVAGDSATIIKLNGVWGLLGGSASLRTSGGDFGASFVQNGYQKLPSGLIIQWGQVTPNATGGATAFSFPIAFPNNCLSMACTLATLTGTGQQTTDVVLANNSNNTTFVAYSYNANGFAQNARTLKYIAIGY